MIRQAEVQPILWIYLSVFVWTDGHVPVLSVCAVIGGVQWPGFYDL